jgi:hypothetical protein
MKDFEITILCDDGETHDVTVQAPNFNEACDEAFNDALVAGWRPVQCEPNTNWDPIVPEPLYSDTDGRCIGYLQPRMTPAQLAASPGIQSWSRPTEDTRFA